MGQKHAMRKCARVGVGGLVLCGYAFSGCGVCMLMCARLVCVCVCLFSVCVCAYVRLWVGVWMCVCV